VTEIRKSRSGRPSVSAADAAVGKSPAAITAPRRARSRRWAQRGDRQGVADPDVPVPAGPRRLEPAAVPRLASSASSLVTCARKSSTPRRRIDAGLRERVCLEVMGSEGIHRVAAPVSISPGQGSGPAK
jgi:hypothetical protein